MKKKCNKCNEIRSFDLFYIRRRNRDGHNGVCKICTKKGPRDKHVMVGNIESKWCKACDQTKALTEFNKNSVRWNSLTLDCTDCIAQKRNYCYVQVRKRKYKTRSYTRKRRERLKELGKRRQRLRMQDPMKKVVHLMRVRMNLALKNNTKSMHTKQMVGASMQEVKEWLESHFSKGMSWENHNKHGWHIDHRIPVAAWDLSNPIEQQMCFSYLNLYPMWAKKNLSKGGKYKEEDKKKYIDNYFKINKIIQI